MSVITPQPVLTYLRDRLRAGLVERELVKDPDLLVMLSEAYRDVCERTRCLVTWGTIQLTGDDSYDLPDTWYETEQLYVAGESIREVAHRDMTDRGAGQPFWCSYVGRTISFSPSPADGTAYIIYAETPDPFASWADELDPRFPAEYAYLLVHHVRWQVLTLSGGAQRIPSQIFEHQLYDTGIANLRRAARRVDSTGPARIRLNDGNVLAG
jgi:hypothetical protein